ncbi:hypothetical protein AURDEDRAFT_22567, partial [Auricularia subglabra TFB-10046 SS5]
RHDMFMANGTSDLVKGERFANVDFATVSSHARYAKLPLFYLFYDIVCQWWIHFRERIRDNETVTSAFPGIAENWPQTMTGVGKYHILNHKDDCRQLRDAHLLPGAGQTDGDNPERVWAVMIKIASSIQEMGIGAREEMMNEHFSAWNAEKSI